MHVIYTMHSQGENVQSCYLVSTEQIYEYEFWNVARL